MKHLYPVALLLLLFLWAPFLKASPRANSQPKLMSDSATVTITRQPSNILSCSAKLPLANLTYTVEAVASNGTLSYQWQTFDGTNWSNITEVRNAIVGTTSPTLGIYWPQQSTFTVRCAVTVTGQKNSLTIYTRSAVIYSPGIPGVRFNAPRPEYVCPGSDLTVSVTGIGRDLTYQWSALGVGDPRTSPTVGDNATSTSITLTNIQPHQEGYYSCAVSNACGTAWTEVFYLGVGSTPAITTQPPSASAVQAGSTVSASVTPSNYWGLKYQWYKDGTTQAVSGATDAPLTLSNVNHTHEGSYVCQISNQCGSVFSQPFVLSVNYPNPPSVTITSQPTNHIVCPKQSPIDTRFSVKAKSTNGTLSYQWQAFENNDWVNLSDDDYANWGSKAPEVNINHEVPMGYKVRCAVTVTGKDTSLTIYSNTAQRAEGVIPLITSNPKGPEYVCVGGNLTLSVTAIGEGLTYRWSGKGAKDSDTLSTITLTNIQQEQDDFYSCSVTGNCLTYWSDSYYLGVSQTPVIETQPTSTSTVKVGTTATAFVKPVDDRYMKYQWYKNGTTQAVAGATDATLTLANTTSADAGSYVCQITNQCGSVFSQPFVLSVTSPEPPKVTITSQPSDQVICVKTYIPPLSFAVKAIASSGTLSYQWQSLNGSTWTNLTDIEYITAGTTTPQMTLLGITNDIYWTVRCAVTVTNNGLSSTVYSNPASTKLHGVPVITSNLTGPEYVCAGSNLTLSFTTNETDLTYRWSGKGVGNNTSSPTLTLTNIQPDQEGLYSCSISNACGMNWTNDYYLTVGTTPIITTQPPSTSAVKAGTPVSVSVGSNSNWELKYQWYRNGTTQPVTGATNSTLTLSNATASDAGSYVCQITNQCGSVFSQPFVLSVTSAEPPKVTITSQPTDFITCPKQERFGGSFSIRATTTSGTLSYQWQAFENNSWVNLVEQQYLHEGTNTPNLEVIKNLPADFAVRCIVTATDNGSSTTVYSNAASKKIYYSPTITSGPSGPDYVCEGSSLTLAVTATGQDLSYRWTKDNVDIPGANSPTVNLTNIQTADQGYYICIVSNQCGGFSSPGYYLVTSKLPTIRQQPPTTLSTCSTDAKSLCVDTEGGAGFYTQWQTRSAATAAWVDVDATIAGSSGDPNSGLQRCLSQLPFLTDGQQYRLKFYAPNCSSVLYSAVTTLQAQSGIAITSQPASSTSVCRGTNVTTSVVATGQNLTYQWYKGSTLLNGSTTATLKLNNIQTSQAGSYTVKITNACGSVTSQAFTVSVTGSAPVISTTYASVTACEGSPLQIAKPVTNDASVTYQWLKGGQPIGSADNGGGLSFALINGSDGGSYSVRVTNGCGSTTSTPFTLTVLSKAVIVTQPVDAVVGCSSTSASFAVAATGQNLTYQWESRDNSSATWQPINNTGVATAQLTVPSGLIGNGRQFRVGVSSATCPGVVYSNAATLTLKSPLVFTQQPVDFTICPGGTARFSINVNNNGGGTVVIRWEYSDGNGWTAASGSGFSGNTTGNFYASGAQLVNGRRFRAVAKVAACPTEVASNEAVLKVDAQYVPTLTGVTPDQIIKSGGTIQGISAGGSGGSGALKLTWSRTMLSALNFSPSLAQSGTGADFPIARTITSTSTANQSLVFTLRVTDALGCSSTALSKVTVLPSTASGRLSVYSAEPVSVLTLYPNPFDGRLLYVRGSGIKAETITLYNLTGVAQPTTSRLVEAELAEVKPLDRLPSGVYVLTLQQGDTLQSYRVLVE